MSRPIPAHHRRADWPEALAAFVESRRDRPFAWGEHDCILFAAGAVAEMIGLDPVAAERGQYHTEAEAELLFAPMGGLGEAMAARCAAHGIPECPPALAQRGDIALVDAGNQLMAGVVVGNTVAVTGTEGLAFLPRRMILRAWAV